jgi:UDP-N-acetylglucosamine--N-acetylmuramyl-(pentapeptide) pyrophosphoryl-undecaprenol N-acetylglucosamine transferase
MLAVAEQLELLGISPSRLRFVGSRRGQEVTLLAGGPIGLTLLPGRGVKRSFAWSSMMSNVVAVVGLATALAVALFKVGRWRPSAVVSVGGYASFATSFSAVLWRCPLVLVEFDAAPGAAQRVLTRFAARRCTAFASDDPRAITTGAPLREAILAVDRSDVARRVARLGFDPPIEPHRMVVVVMTGSLGSHRVNMAANELVELWSERNDRTVIHVTGRRDFAEMMAARPKTAQLDYRVVEFGDMTRLWALCDVAVCRSGAITLSELTALGIASVLVPLADAHRAITRRRTPKVWSQLVARVLVRDVDCKGASSGGDVGRGHGARASWRRCRRPPCIARPPRTPPTPLPRSWWNLRGCREHRSSPLRARTSWASAEPA